MKEQDEDFPQNDFFFGPDWFKRTELAPGITAIGEPYHSEEVVSYVIQGSKQSILIDTGMGLADIKSVIPQAVVSVLLTHTHWDHLGGVSGFENVWVYNDPFEIMRLTNGWRGLEIVGYNREEFDQNHQPPKNYDHKDLYLPGHKSFKVFGDRDQFDLGDDIIEVIHTPGHTPGSVCFYSHNRQALFTGDTLYPGPEYLHLPESDYLDYFESLRLLVNFTKGRLRMIYPGHNATSSEPQLLQDHLDAAIGVLHPESIERGTDAFGPYIQKKYDGFSLMLPDV